MKDKKKKGYHNQLGLQIFKTKCLKSHLKTEHRKVYPFSGRCHGGPRTGPAVALTLTLEPFLTSISEL